MTDDFDITDDVVVGALGIWMGAMGVRMILKPASLSKGSIMYRHMVTRVGNLSRAVRESGELTLSQVRLYGVILLILSFLMLLVIVWPFL